MAVSIAQLVLSLAEIIWLFQKLCFHLKGWHLWAHLGKLAIGYREFQNPLEQPSTHWKVQSSLAKSQRIESSGIKLILDQPWHLQVIKNCIQYNLESKTKIT